MLIAYTSNYANLFLQSGAHVRSLSSLATNVTSGLAAVDGRYVRYLHTFRFYSKAYLLHQMRIHHVYIVLTCFILVE